MAIGVVLSPIITDTIGWQSIFFMCAPIAAVLLFMCWRVLPIDESAKILEHGIPSASVIEVRRKEDVIDKNGVDEKKKKGKLALDVKGIITLSLSLVSFLVAITNSSSLQEDPLGFAIPMVIGAISCIVYSSREEGLIASCTFKAASSATHICRKHSNANVRYHIVYHYNGDTTVRQRRRAPVWDLI